MCVRRVCGTSQEDIVIPNALLAGFSQVPCRISPAGPARAALLSALHSCLCEVVNEGQSKHKHSYLTSHFICILKNWKHAKLPYRFVVKTGKSGVLQMEISPIKHVSYWRIAYSRAALKHDESTDLSANSVMYIMARVCDISKDPSRMKSETNRCKLCFLNFWLFLNMTQIKSVKTNSFSHRQLRSFKRPVPRDNLSRYKTMTFAPRRADITLPINKKMSQLVT